MKALIATVFLAIMSATTTGGEQLLRGTWTGNDRAAESIYGKISLSQKEISRGGFNKFNPKCKTTHKVARSYTGPLTREIPMNPSPEEPTPSSTSSWAPHGVIVDQGGPGVPPGAVVKLRRREETVRLQQRIR